jgi:hypothetical protein
MNTTAKLLSIARRPAMLSVAEYREIPRKKTPKQPDGYVEYQLMQAVADAIKEIGKERTMQIVKEASE